MSVLWKVSINSRALLSFSWTRREQIATFRRLIFSHLYVNITCQAFLEYQFSLACSFKALMQILTEKCVTYSLILHLALVFMFLFKCLNSDSLVCGTCWCMSAWHVREGDSWFCMRALSECRDIFLLAKVPFFLRCFTVLMAGDFTSTRHNFFPVYIQHLNSRVQLECPNACSERQRTYFRNTGLVICSFTFFFKHQ